MTQSEALKILKNGGNVFLTGQPGSGKTYLLKEYIDYLKKEGVKVGVTASTGIAATHLNGITIHSWSGIGINDKMTESDIKDLHRKKWLRERIPDTEVLIIDEVSMLGADQLDLINEITKSFKGNQFEPFGGMQVVLSGDFFQLPPVGGGSVEFAFNSTAWEELDLEVCYLTDQWRQTDKDYLKILRDIRSGSVSEETKSVLKSRLNTKTERETDPTNLYTHNRDVDRENKEKLKKLNSKPHHFSMSSEGTEPLVEKLKEGVLAPETLTLKKEAPVMFLKNNFDKGYVNGSLGRVVGFKASGPVVKLEDGKEVTVKKKDWKVEEDGKIKAKVTQYPLRLAWAITIHKSQGMSLSAAKMDLSNCFEPGMGYVALSRVSSLEGLKLLGLGKKAFQVNKEVLKFNKKLKRKKG